MPRAVGRDAEGPRVGWQLDAFHLGVAVEEVRVVREVEGDAELLTLDLGRHLERDGAVARVHAEDHLGLLDGDLVANHHDHVLQVMPLERPIRQALVTIDHLEARRLEVGLSPRRVAVCGRALAGVVDVAMGQALAPGRAQLDGGGDVEAALPGHLLGLLHPHVQEHRAARHHLGGGLVLRVDGPQLRVAVVARHELDVEGEGELPGVVDVALDQALLGQGRIADLVAQG